MHNYTYYTHTRACGSTVDRQCPVTPAVPHSGCVSLRTVDAHKRSRHLSPCSTNDAAPLTPVTH